MNFCHTDHTFYSLNLGEIERDLEDQEKHSIMHDSQDIGLEKIIPSRYHDLLDVHSKFAFNKLPPHRSYHQKTELENQHQFTAGPLHPMFSDELKAVRKYLIENLDKSFIEPSRAPFSSPVHFVKKSDGGIRFCIDF